MDALLIDGRKIAEEIKSEIKSGTERLKTGRGIVPGLAFVLIGDNPASQSYVGMKGKGCRDVGFYSITEKLHADISESQVLFTIDKFNRDKNIHGILVQLPLPGHLDEYKIISAIDHRKDVDGLHPENVGRLVAGRPCLRPCTPAGIVELLMRTGNDPSGKHAVIVGRSNIVGKPMANILMQKKKGANAVVTVAHTGAADISVFTREADILIAAIGKPECITGEIIRPGAVVVDVGINRVPDRSAKNGYRIAGDVHFESASRVAGAITPVPGGVGPMTIAMVLKNTLIAAQGTIE